MLKPASTRRFRKKHGPWPAPLVEIELLVMAGVRVICAGLLSTDLSQYTALMQSPSQINSTSGASPKAGKDRERDLTGDLARRNATLEEENRKLQQLAEYRSAYLAHLAHELRTPLTSILGFAEILLDHEALTEAQRSFCERIQNSAQQMQDSLKQLADVSRLEAVRSDFLREDLSLNDLLRESCASLAREAQKQDITLEFQGSEAGPWIISERGKLRHVFCNLLNYAIARSPNGSRVLISTEPEGGNFLVGIEDEGEPVDTSEFGNPDLSNRKPDAIQLSLAIMRHTLELLGASLSAKNCKPRGLQIRVIVPPAPPDL